VHEVFPDETFEEDVMSSVVTWRHNMAADGTAKIAIELRTMWSRQARQVERLAKRADAESDYVAVSSVTSPSSDQKAKPNKHFKNLFFEN